VNGLTDVCTNCGAVFYVDSGHACAVAAWLPEGTPHPVPALAAQGWLVVRGIWQRTAGGGGGEDVAA
jgi:hypothetical protein